MGVIKVIKTNQTKQHKQRDEQTLFYLKNIDELFKHEIQIHPHILTIPHWYNFIYTFVNVNDMQITNTNNPLDIDIDIDIDNSSRESNFKVVKYNKSNMTPLIKKINSYYDKKKIVVMIQSFENCLYYLHILHNNGLIHNNLNLKTILLDEYDFIFFSDFSFAFKSTKLATHDMNHLTKGAMPVYFQELWNLSGVLDKQTIQDILVKIESYFQETNILYKEECDLCVQKYHDFLLTFTNFNNNNIYNNINDNNIYKSQKDKIINELSNLLFSWDVISLAISYLYLYRTYFSSFCKKCEIETFLVNLLCPPWNYNLLETMESFRKIYFSIDTSVWKVILKQSS